MVWRAKWDIDNSWFATEHFRKPNHGMLFKAFCVVSYFSVQHCLAESFTSVSQTGLPASNSFPAYWAMRSIKLSDSCSNVSSFHVRHSPLQEPVRKEHFSTQYFCHQMCYTNHINPLHWLMNNHKPPQNKFCVWFLTLASSFQEHAWALQSLL